MTQHPGCRAARHARTIATLTLAALLGAGAAGAQAADPARAVPPDSAVRIGVLPNGLTWYVRRNGKPENRAELRLVVNAGSVLEDDDQRGLAHFLEHMAFNGTARFEKQEIVDFLESVGMRFGADLNAYTSYDETVYMLTIPTDSQRVVGRALDILEDWAQRISLDTAEIAAERGVVLEEWRARLGAGSRLGDRIDSVLFRGSPYATRKPIGERARIETAERAELLRYYRDWYRPDLMAVVVVGDFDPAAMEAEVRWRFGALPAVGTRRARPAVTLPDEPGTRFSIVTDREATGSGVQVIHRVPVRHPRGTIGSWRASLAEGLFHSMLGQRLSELARKPEAPFLGGGTSGGRLVREVPVLSIGASAKEDRIEGALAAVLTEVERVRQHGFTQPELDRARLSVLRSLESRVAAQEAITSGSLASGYVDHFLTGGAIPGATGALALAREILPSFTLDSVRQPASVWRDTTNRAVIVTLPEKAGLRVPAAARLLAVFDSVAALRLDPWREELADAPLVARAPAPGRVVSERRHPAVDVTEWRLSNGARVLLKPTPFNADQVAIRGVSAGGTSLAPDSLVRHATSATGILAVGGLGAFPLDDLRKRLAGKVVSVGASIGGTTEEVSASGSPRDLETMLQLMYLQFTAPRVDSTAIAAWRASMRERLRNRSSSPAAAFQDTLVSVLTQAHPRAKPLTPEAVDSVRVERALRFHRERFADASDFTFVVVGAIVPDSIRPLVERWIGALPAAPAARRRSERARDTGVRPPAGVVRRTVRAGSEPRSSTQMVFTGTAANVTPAAHYELDALEQLLDRRLTDRLREALGGTYSPSVSGSLWSRPTARYELSIGFGSAPERVDELVGATLEVIEALRRDGPTAQELHDIAEAQRRSRETGLKQNGYWLGMLTSYVQESWEFASLAADQPPGGGTSLTAARLTEAARRYLDLSNYVLVTLYPNAPAGSTP
jgi:zinc protease